MKQITSVDGTRRPGGIISLQGGAIIQESPGGIIPLQTGAFIGIGTPRRQVDDRGAVPAYALPLTVPPRGQRADEEQEQTDIAAPLSLMSPAAAANPGGKSAVSRKDGMIQILQANRGDACVQATTLACDCRN